MGGLKSCLDPFPRAERIHSQPLSRRHASGLQIFHTVLVLSCSDHLHKRKVHVLELNEAQSAPFVNIVLVSSSGVLVLITSECKQAL